MRRSILSLLCAASLGMSLPCAAAEFAVLVKLGLKDKAATDWSGSVRVEGGEITQLQGWRFRGKDSIGSNSSWTATSVDPGGPKDRKQRPAVAPTGVLVCGQGGSGTTLSVSTPRGEFAIALEQLAFGQRVVSLDGAASAERTAAPTVLSDSEREDDYPSVCVTPAGVVWCVWQSYKALSERLLVASMRNGVWSAPEPIPGAEGDIYKSACAWTAGRLWVVWAQFEEGDWDLWCASDDGTGWDAPRRLTTGKGADVEPAMAAGAGGAYLVWQGWRGSHSDIWLMVLSAGKWGSAQRVTAAPGNDWMPQVAVSGDGSVSVVWDTYRNGDYDVYLRQWARGAFGPETAVAASENFEAYATVAVDAGNRVWIAYEEGTPNWGKDQGAVVPRPAPGTRLYSQRLTKVRVLDKGKLFEPSAQPVAIAPGGQPKRFHEKPRLTADGNGRIYLGIRWAMATVRYLSGRGHYRHYKAWESYVTRYEGDSWVEPTYLPQSICRLDSHVVPVGLPTGGVAAVWHTDNRTMSDVRMPVRNQVVASALLLDGAPPAPVLKAVELPVPSAPEPAAKEVEDTKRIRDYRALVQGRAQRIVRGDTHRHTEVSWDGSGDGSMVDVWRYGIDAGALDFLEITDHNQRTGPDLEYVWWRTQKLTDVYHNPPHFITLFGYERSLGFPNGHRNVINAKRGYRTFPISRGPEGRGVAADDTKQLYANERDRGSVIISHTSGTNMGTDWRDNDPVLEPVVEIYQGARTSYEYEGAPKSAAPGDRHARSSGYQPEGFLWRAWEMGLRLGIIASSDHGSTHISYASVYVDAPTRAAIVAGLRRRHTFGATDNIILELRSGDHFMGDEFSATAPPLLQIKALGTAELSELAIVKDLRFVYSGDPEGMDAEFSWEDTEFEPGTHLYYVRIQQTDGQIAWSSPIWITRQ